MSRRSVRLFRVASTLTAQERAVLILLASKGGKDEDPAVRWNMPPEQGPEFNRLMTLLDGVNRWIGIYLFELKGALRELGVRRAWLASTVLWQHQAFELAAFIMGCTKELITESDYRLKEQEARAEYRPAAELAYVLTEHYDGFADEDLDPESPEDDHAVLPESWERIQAEKVSEIASLVRSGKLKGKGRGKGLKVEAGGFYDRLGEPVPVLPAWAAAYEVVPDDEGERAAAHRYRREAAHKAYRDGPTAPVVHLADVGEDSMPRTPSHVNEFVASHKETLKEGVADVWQQVRAVERVIAEVAADFDGEDPAMPDVREAIDSCRDELADLHEDVQRYVGPFDVPEPDEDQLAAVRRLAEREL